MANTSVGYDNTKKFIDKHLESQNYLICLYFSFLVTLCSTCHRLLQKL